MPFQSQYSKKIERRNRIKLIKTGNWFEMMPMVSVGTINSERNNRWSVCEEFC